MTALKGLTVIETATRVAGEYAGKLLADFGAEVVKVEPPGGAPTRASGPFHNGCSTVFQYLNTNKKSVVLDLATEADRGVLDRLLARAHALIDDHTPAWAAAHGLSQTGVAERHPRLVHTAITAFGQTAPADWQIARPINVMNAGGWAWHTPSESSPAQPPLKGAGRFMSDYEAGLEAAMALAASLYRQRRSGEGQFIDIAEVGVQFSRADTVIGRILAGDADAGPERTRYDMGGPGTSFACSDGSVFLVMTTREHWLGLCTLMGNPEWVAGFRDDWLEFHCTPDRVAAFRTHFAGWIKDQPREAVSEAAQKLGVALVPLNTAADLPDNPQYRHRGYFQRLDGVLYPTVPYRMSASPARIATAAPALGAHQSQAA
jgi:crotonobetainyl-CoA:carnitine CoA-transferase CaiB-like acyl-CoA transferase